MDSVSAEQQKFHQLSLTKKTLRDIDIPPRKLVSRRATAPEFFESFMDSPRSAEETLLQKFLPYNSGGDDDDPYSADDFRMYEFKVRRCTRSRSHDWTDCPFAHPGEKARRRDPRRYHYSGTVCPDFRRGGCARGDTCEFAHGVFECWLHPARYRTEACKDGQNCKRKVCFFAHTPRQLRVLPSHSHENFPSSEEKKRLNSNHCCVYCHKFTASPASTLMGPSSSQPLSPVKSRQSGGFSPISRLASVGSCGLSYKDVVTELMSSLEAMSVNEAAQVVTNNRNLAWVDVSSIGDDHQQFVLSPSTPSPSGSAHFSNGDHSTIRFTDGNGLVGPDFEWVNDLLT